MSNTDSRLTPKASLRILATSDDWQALSEPRWLDVTDDTDRGSLTSSTSPEALPAELQNRLLNAGDMQALEDSGAAFIVMRFGSHRA